MSDVVEVFGSANGLVAGTVLLRSVPWSGGRGWIVVEGLQGNGSPQIGVAFVGPNGTLTPPGIAPISADGIYPFELPKGAFTFNVNLQVGQTIIWNSVIIAPTTQRG